MNKLYLRGSIVPALIVAGLACLLIAAAASAAPIKPSKGAQLRDGNGRTMKAGHRRHGYGWYPGPRRIVVVPPRRRYSNVRIVRPHGHRYPGYGYYLYDPPAYRWLGLTAISVTSLNDLTEAQQRRHEAAQVTATTAPVGEVIHWRNSDASGSVTPVREGRNSAGRYCREFRQEVTIGGKSEQAYGTACQQPDGAWEVIP